MEESALFWSTYKNLENETLKLSEYINFSSDQKSVYSAHIADLIVRCVIDIESISKKLYGALGGDMDPLDKSGNRRDLYFDTDCLDLLETKYRLSQKTVMVSAPTFSFDEKDQTFEPFKNSNKRGSSGCKWKQAYEALKHDRYESLKKYATIENLLHALASLYLLNLYFKNKTYEIKGEFKSFDERIDSDIFSVLIYDATNISVSAKGVDDNDIIEKPDANLDHSTYVIKRTDKNVKELWNAFTKFEQDAINNIKNSPQVQDFLEQNKGYHADSYADLAMDALGEKGLLKLLPVKNLTEKFVSNETEAILNKHQGIYTSIDFER